MRHSVAAIALIRRQESGRTLWLAQWNKNWKAYAFVGGHKRLEESFRECVIREVAEELRLAPGEQFTAAAEPLAHLEYTAWSQSAQEETQYTMELFKVELTDSARCGVDAESINCWLSEEEIRKQQTKNGQPVSSTVQLILEKAGLAGAER
jgi:8-oxo-dGTP pyrophosphatase MutT (NUDIX family)